MDVMSKKKRHLKVPLSDLNHFIRIYPYYHYPFVMSVNTYYKAESSIYTRLLVHKRQEIWDQYWSDATSPIIIDMLRLLKESAL